MCRGDFQSRARSRRLTYESPEKLIDINQVHDTLTHGESSVDKFFS